VKSSEDKYNYIERIERQLLQKEEKLRWQAKRAEVNDQDAKFYTTVKHQPETSRKLWDRKVVLGLKLLALAIVAIIAVKVVSIIAGIAIVGLLTVVTYKLFFD
jgi:Flp pilus assembly protein TadB